MLKQRIDEGLVGYAWVTSLGKGREHEGWGNEEEESFEELDLRRHRGTVQDWRGEEDRDGGNDDKDNDDDDDDEGCKDVAVFNDFDKYLFNKSNKIWGSRIGFSTTSFMPTFKKCCFWWSWALLVTAIMGTFRFEGKIVKFSIDFKSNVEDEGEHFRDGWWLHIEE